MKDPLILNRLFLYVFFIFFLYINHECSGLLANYVTPELIVALRNSIPVKKKPRFAAIQCKSSKRNENLTQIICLVGFSVVGAGVIRIGIPRHI